MSVDENVQWKMYVQTIVGKHCCPAKLITVCSRVTAEVIVFLLVYMGTGAIAGMHWEDISKKLWESWEKTERPGDIEDRTSNEERWE